MKDYSRSIRENRVTRRYFPDFPLHGLLRSGAGEGAVTTSEEILVKNISKLGCGILTTNGLSKANFYQLGLTVDNLAKLPFLDVDFVWQKNIEDTGNPKAKFELGFRFRNSDQAHDIFSELLSSISNEFTELKRMENSLGQQVCGRCILSDRIPGVKFNSAGVCNFCEDYETKEAPQQKKVDYVLLEANLIKALKTNPKKHPYDCLCLYSGGKDSTYMLHLLVNKYKLRVLAFTFDNYFIAPETYQNMKKVLLKLNVDHILFKPSWQLNKSIFKTGMMHSDKLDTSKELAFMIGHACWPCFTQISMHSIKLALDKNIPNVVVGTTPGQIRQKKYDLVSKFNGLVDVYQTMVVPMMKLLKITGQDRIKNDLSISFFKQLKVLRMKLVPFYEYIHYNEAVVLETVKRELAWESPKSTDSCSTNCQLNSLGIQMHKEKYGVSPYMIPLARDVREGLVDRLDGLRALTGELNQGLVKGIADKFEVEIGVNNE